MHISIGADWNMRMLLVVLKFLVVDGAVENAIRVGRPKESVVSSSDQYADTAIVCVD